MSLHQSNIAMLRHLGVALEAEAAEVNHLSEDARPEAHKRDLIVAQILRRTGWACNRAAKLLQNDADALLRGPLDREESK